jgi:hypothetical protein
MNSNYMLWVLAGVLVASFCISNCNLMVLYKNVSCIYTQYLNALGTVLVWALSLAFGLETLSFQNGGVYLQVGGFVVLVISN